MIVTYIIIKLTRQNGSHCLNVHILTEPLSFGTPFFELKKNIPVTAWRLVIRPTPNDVEEGPLVRTKQLSTFLVRFIASKRRLPASIGRAYKVARIIPHGGGVTDTVLAKAARTNLQERDSLTGRRRHGTHADRRSHAGLEQHLPDQRRPTYCPFVTVSPARSLLKHLW